MKLRLKFDEKRFIANNLYQLAIEAGQTGEKSLYKNFIQVANRFSDNSLDSIINKHEAELILDLSNKTLFQITTDLIPKIEKSNKSTETKEESLKKAKEILDVTERVIKIFEEKLESN